MRDDRTGRRRIAAGLTTMAIGAAAVVAGLAAPAGAHDGEREPDKIPETNSLSCAALAERYGIEADWTESKIEAGELPAEGESETYDLTPDDGDDDAFVTIDMVMTLKNFNWNATVGIDAVYVKAGSYGSTYYGYQPEISGYNSTSPGDVVGEGEEVSEDIDLGTLPWRKPGKNQISHVTFCWDGEGGDTPPPTDTPPDDTPPPADEDECPEGEAVPQGDEGGDMGGDETPAECGTPPADTPPPADTQPDDTAPDVTTTTVGTPSSTTVPDDAWAVESTTTTLDVTPTSDTLPNTGSNATTMLVLAGLVLLAAGGGLVATRNRWLKRS